LREEWKGLMVDAMLGSLARRARLMGVDTLYMRDETDREITMLSQETGRWLVTRDRALAERTHPRSLLIETTDPDKGWSILLEWLLAHGVEIKPGSRCSVCNTPLVPVDANSLGDRVPEDVREKDEETWLCRGCGRAYWKGSHWSGIMSHGP